VFASETSESHVGDLDLNDNGSTLAYLVGTRDSPITLQGGVTLTNQHGGFVGRLNPLTGDAIWATSMPGMRGVEATEDGQNVVIYGQTQGSDSVYVLTDATGQTVTMRSRGSWDIFVAKMRASDGAGLWAVDGGGDSMEYMWGMCLDSADNIYVSGYSRSNVLTFGDISFTSPANESPRKNRDYAIKLSGTATQPDCLSSCDMRFPPTTGCFIDNYCIPEGQYSPYGYQECYKCDPKDSTHDWSGPELTGHCFIDDKCYADGVPKMVREPGARSPTPSDCESCDVASSVSGWTVANNYNLVDGKCVLKSPSPTPPPPTPPPSRSPPPTESGDDDDSSGITLSKGEMAGVIVGVVVGTALIAAAVTCLVAKKSSAPRGKAAMSVNGV